MRAKTTLKSLPKTETTLEGHHLQNPRVERWQLQQVYDIYYSMDLVLDLLKQSRDEAVVDVYHMLRPHMNQLSNLFDGEVEEGNLGSALRDSKQD